MKEVFDDIYGEEIAGLYDEAMWGELDDELKESLVAATINVLTSRDIGIPKENEIVRRLKGFYTSRRTVRLTNRDPVKKRARKLAVKANNLTYI